MYERGNSGKSVVHLDKPRLLNLDVSTGNTTPCLYLQTVQVDYVCYATVYLFTMKWAGLISLGEITLYLTSQAVLAMTIAE